MKQKIGIETSAANASSERGVLSLMFHVVPAGDGLYSAQMVMLVGDTVSERRTGVATTLGHAIAAADEALDGWAFSQIEIKPEDYFQMVIL